MKLESRKAKILAIVFALLIVALVTISSYAYFSASVLGNDQSKNTVITTGKMEVTFTDGQQITANNLIPGDYVEKTFTVKNTGDVLAVYGIYFNGVVNTFENPEELVYELISEDGQTVSQTKCPTIDEKLAEGIQIDVGETHNYTLKMTFLNKDYNQDTNQGKIFKATINLTKIYDSVRKVKQNVRIGGYDYNSNKKEYDVDYASLNDFGNKYYNYLKQDVTRYFGTMSNYYIFEGEMKDNIEETLEECNNDVVNYFSEAHCYEKNGEKWIKIKSDPFNTIDECKNNFYIYNSDTGELEKPNDETRYGECKKESGTIKEVLIDAFGDNSTSEVCFYNGGDEICFDEWIDFNVIDRHSEQGLRKIFDDEENMYNKIKNKKDFSCNSKNYGMACISEDNLILDYDDNGLRIYEWGYSNQYLHFEKKIKYDSLYECHTNHEQFSSGFYECVLEDDGIYYYYSPNEVNGWTGDPYNTHSTMQECEEYCDSRSGDCYCVKIFWPPYQAEYFMCSLNANNSRCYSMRTE